MHFPSGEGGFGIGGGSVGLNEIDQDQLEYKILLLIILMVLILSEKMAVKYMNITCMYVHIANRMYNPIGLCRSILWDTHKKPT